MPVNDYPVLPNRFLTITMKQNTGPEKTDVLTGVTSTDGDKLTVKFLLPSINGKVSLSTTGEVLYTPNRDFVGVDLIIYQVCKNGIGDYCSQGQIDITVTPVALPVNPPEISAIHETIKQNQTLLFSQSEYTSGFTGYNGRQLVSVRVESLPSHGLLQLSGITVGIGQEILLAELNKLSYVPVQDFTGDDSFRWSAFDGSQYSTTSDFVFIVVEKSEIFIPGGFSPNGDGINDYFVIKGADQYIVKLRIFNRWGNLVYTNDYYKNDWEGMANVGMLITNQLPGGTYFYTINFSNGEKERVGYLTLNR
jgi:gliding motility-associated-like protein